MRKLPTIESTIMAVVKTGNGYPDPDWLASYRGISQDAAYAAMVEHRANTDWQSMDIPVPPMPKAPDREISLDDVTVRVDNGGRVNSIHSIHSIPKDILKGVFAILSILCAIRSWGFVYTWFAQWDSGFFSVILASILVGVQIAMPQAIIFAVREYRYALTTICTLVVVISVLFSMITTIGGLYNDRSKSIQFASAQDSQSAGVNDQLQRLELENSRILDGQKIDIVELGTLQKNLEKYQPGTYEYNRTVNRIDAVKARIDAANAKVAKNDSVRLSVSSAVVYTVKRNDFYQFLDDITGLDTKLLEFIISIIVSIIVDIAGPVFATLALFL